MKFETVFNVRLGKTLHPPGTVLSLSEADALPLVKAGALQVILEPVAAPKAKGKEQPTMPPPAEPAPASEPPGGAA